MLRSWAAGNADVLVRYMQAYIEGLRWGVDPKNQAEAIKLYIDALKLNEDDGRAHAGDRRASDRRTDARRALDLRRLQQRAAPARQRDEAMGAASAPAPEKYLDASYYDEGAGRACNGSTARLTDRACRPCSSSVFSTPLIEKSL